MWKCRTAILYLGFDVGQVGGVEVGCGVHPFIHILFLDIGVSIDVNDTDILGGDTGNSTDGWESNTVVSTQNDGHGTGTGDVRNGIGDLVKTLFQIGRNSKDISGIAERHLFSKINALFVVVGCVESTDATNSLRTETSAGTIGAASVKWHADDSSIVVSNETGVFDVGSLEEGVDSSKVRQLSSRKSGNGLVFDGTSSRQTDLEMTGNFRVMYSGGDGGFLWHCGVWDRSDNVNTIYTADIWQPVF